jgi:hypothetical protein
VPAEYDDEEREPARNCPSCEQWIPESRIDVHLDGLDGAHPECPRQDLTLIVEQARREEYLRQRSPWGRLYGRRRWSWTW